MKFNFVEHFLKNKIDSENKEDSQKEELLIEIANLQDRIKNLKYLVRNKCSHSFLNVKINTESSGDGYGGTDYYDYLIIKCKYCDEYSKIYEGRPFVFDVDGLNIKHRVKLQESFEEYERQKWIADKEIREKLEKEREFKLYQQLKEKFKG
jgi:hypothetical protein